MDDMLEPLTRSPRLPKLVTDLEELLRCETESRQHFYDALRPDQKAEFINGEVIVQSPAKTRHIEVTLRLATLLNSYVTARNLGKVLIEKALIALTRNDYEPDIVFFSTEKATDIQPDQTKFPAPDLIVEVLSPSTERIDRGIKLEDYAAHGVAEYWIIDAERATIEQYVADAGVYRLETRKTDGELRSTVVAGFRIPVRAIFDDATNLATLRALLK